MVIKIFRLSSWLYRNSIPILPSFFYAINRIVFAVVLPPSVKVGSGFVLAYQGLGTVIHARTSIGESVYVGPQVIIGGRSGEYAVPVIGNNVFIGAGARILGPVVIGDGATVAAGAVVIQDVLSGETVAGVPAKVIDSHRKENPCV